MGTEATRKAYKGVRTSWMRGKIRSLEGLLHEDGHSADIKNDAIKSVLAYKLEEAMKA